MPSLADKTKMSAQETTPGHSLSTASLMVSRYLKFLSPKLLSVSFSERLLLVESSRSEASHDYKKNKNNQPHHQNVIETTKIEREWERTSVAYLNSTVMEDVPEPWEGSVLVALVEKLNLLCDDILCLRAWLLVKVHNKARVLLILCKSRPQNHSWEGEKSKEEETPGSHFLSLLERWVCMISCFFHWVLK